MHKRIILIGGMPTAGKSTVARAIARHFDLPWISTDQICVVMQSVADPKQYPKLFYPEDATPEEFLKDHTDEYIMNLEYSQDHEIWRGVQAFIDKDSTWRNGCVIEGVAILPELVASTYSDNPDVKAVFLTDSNHERTRNIVFTRGVWTDADQYSDSVKEKEIDWIRLFDQKIREDAGKFNLPLIEVNKGIHDIDRVLKAIE